MKLKLEGSKSGTKMDKEELNTWLVLGLIVMIGAFCLFGSKSLLSKAIYQQKVISASHKAAKQLNTNITAADSLSNQYKGLFENDSPSNVIGGKNDKSANAVPPNVNNSRLALDA